MICLHRWMIMAFWNLLIEWEISHILNGELFLFGIEPKTFDQLWTLKCVHIHVLSWLFDEFKLHGIQFKINLQTNRYYLAIYFRKHTSLWMNKQRTSSTIRHHWLCTWRKHKMFTWLLFSNSGRVWTENFLFWFEFYFQNEFTDIL